MAKPREIDLVALIDASGSMAINGKRVIALDALHRIERRWHDLDAPAPLAARVWVVAVGERSTPLAESIPLNGLGARLAELDADGAFLPEGRAELASAIAWAEALEATNDDARRAFVLLSDGHDVAAFEHSSETPWDLRCAVAVGADADIKALRAFVGEQGVAVEAATIDRLVFALDALAWDGRQEAMPEHLTPLGVPGAGHPSRVARGDELIHDGSARAAGDTSAPTAGPASGTTVTDTSGIVHFLRDAISEGGEGCVYRTRDPRIGVKVLREPAERIAAVRRLPLEGIQLARPGASLGDADGYVMRLLTGMDTLGLALGVDLRRSLRVLGNLAGLLGALHARGLVHHDVKPSNVLVSETAERTLVWLIDADNVATHGESDSAVTTLSFEPPEGPTGSWFRDRFALSVLVHLMLTGRHPWLGSAAAYESWQEEWCREPGLARDRRNAEKGEGRSLAAATGDRLRELAETAFGPGLADATRRPSALDWAHALHAAADLTLRCKAAGCETSYYARSRACPVCGEPRGRVTLVRLHRVAGDGVPAPERPDSCLALRRGEEAWITERHVLTSVSAGQEEDALVHVGVRGSLVSLDRTVRGDVSGLEIRTRVRQRTRSARPPRAPFGQPQTGTSFRLAEGKAGVAGLIGGPALIPHAIVVEQTHA